jgi:hypothetical protein
VAPRTGRSAAQALVDAGHGAGIHLAEVGLRVPADLSIVSFDDSDLAAWLRPALPSVALPHVELGRRAVELLLDPARSAGVELVPMPLHARNSVGRRGPDYSPPAAPTHVRWPIRRSRRAWA